MIVRLRLLACLALTGLALLLAARPAQAQNRLTMIAYSYACDQSTPLPAPTIRLYAFLTQGSPPYNTLNTTWSFQSATITVDGTPQTATLSSSNICYIDWNSSGAANPSEHTASVTATVHCAYPLSTQTLSSNTTAPPPAQGPYNAIYGDGRVADFVVADICLKSLGFTGNVPLSQDAVTPVPSPEFTWNPASNSLTTSNPAGYIQGKNVGLTMQVCKPDGTALGSGATMGYTLKLQATPNTTNPSTSQPDPVLTLFDCTTATPVAPTPFTNPIAVSATTALDSWVAQYGLSFSALNFYVEFTHVTPSPTWGEVNSYASAGSPVTGTVYAVLGQPTVPMATPWVGVLNDACNWAKRTTSPLSATTALVTGEYNNCTYNGGHRQFTDPFTDTNETFHLLAFLNYSNPTLYGQCNDFSDFLDCLSNALGAMPLYSQRSASLADLRAGAHFQTKPITAPHDQNAGDAAPFPGGWAYHQWTNDASVFDACLRFNGVTSPINMTGPALGSVYNTDLVASYDGTGIPTVDWDPQTPFIPTIAN